MQNQNLVLIGIGNSIVQVLKNQVTNWLGKLNLKQVLKKDNTVHKISIDMNLHKSSLFGI